MRRFTTHICLVSDQLLPNLLPCCNHQWRPQQVVLLVTAAMQSRGERLAEMLRQLGCAVSICQLDSYALDAMQRRLAELMRDHCAAELAINITGGNKLMALAAFMQAWSDDVAAFYVDTAADTLWRLGEPSVAVPLPDVLGIKRYLGAYGYRLLKGQARQGVARRDLCLAIVERLEQWEQALPKLNYYAAQAKGSLNVVIGRGDVARADFIALLDLLRSAAVLDIADDRLVFANEQARVFANGGWLEEYVYAEVEQLRREGRVRDVCLNAVIEDEAGTMNEIDVLFTARNRLFMIECKSKKMHGDHARVDDMVYKLDSLKNLVGGLYGRAMLASCFRPGASDCRRCAGYDITLVAARGLKNLRSTVCRWIGE